MEKENAPGGAQQITTYDFGTIESCRLIITNNEQEYLKWKNQGVAIVDFPSIESSFYVVGILADI